MEIFYSTDTPPRVNVLDGVLRRPKRGTEAGVSATAHPDRFTAPGLTSSVAIAFPEAASGSSLRVAASNRSQRPAPHGLNFEVTATTKTKQIVVVPEVTRINQSTGYSHYRRFLWHAPARSSMMIVTTEVLSITT